MNAMHLCFLKAAHGSLALVLTLFALLLAPTEAASSLAIFNESATYVYHGCWTETTELANTTRRRALDGGGGPDAQLQLPDTMTVPLCLDHCARNTTTTPFVYAGLEYSRECWCADHLSPLSVRLPDADCDTPCDGDMATACGGALKLSVYELRRDQAGSAPSATLGSATMFRVVGAMLVVLGVSRAFAFHS